MLASLLVGRSGSRGFFSDSLNLFHSLFLILLLGFFASARAQDSCFLDGQWTTPPPDIFVYNLDAGKLTGVPDPTNSNSPSDPKAVFERHVTPNPGLPVVSVRIGLGQLSDPDDSLRFQVGIYDDNGSGLPGALIGASALLSPTALGVASGNFVSTHVIDMPTSPVPSTNSFHVGIEFFPVDGLDQLSVVTSCGHCTPPQGEGDNSNFIRTTGFGFESIQSVYSRNLDVFLIPRMQGPDAAFSYSQNLYFIDEPNDPVANITGTPGGTFSASPGGLSINAATGQIDLSTSAVGNYIVTYTVSTPTTCENSGTFSLRIENPARIGDRVWNDLNGNGVQDGGEPGLSGVQLYLDDNLNGVLDGGEATAISDGTGAYQFGSLLLGSYQVAVNGASVPAGWVLTTANDPTALTLNTGELRSDVDFGFQQQDAFIGDFVWNDLDGDGVQDAGEPGLSGVRVFLDANLNGVFDGGEIADLSDGSGAYQLTNLPAGVYSVKLDVATRPAGFVQTTADPVSVTLAAGEDFNNADFGLQQQNAFIGDFVWNDLNGDGIQDAGEAGQAGIAVFLDLNLNGALDAGEPVDVSDGAGAYAFTGLPAGSYSVRLDLSTVPANYTVTTPADYALVLAAGEVNTGADFGVQQPIEISVNDVSQVEGNAGTSALVFTVTLSQTFAGTITVDYALTPGSATPGEDYVDTSGTLTFNPNVVSQSLAVDVLGDEVFESDETFTVQLSNPTNALLNDATGAGTIQNDDGQPSLSVDDVSIVEGDSGNSALTFTVSLSNGSSEDISVNYQTASGSASAGVDFVDTSGALSIPATSLNGVVSVDVIGDFLIEGDETFTVELSTPVNASLNDAQGQGTILNDDEGADLVLIMGVAPEGLIYGEVLSYTLQVTNLGPEVALDSVVTVNLAEGLDFIQASTTLGSCAHLNGVVNCALGDVALDQVVDLLIDVEANTTGTIYTQASVVSQISDDPQNANNASVRGIIVGAVPVPGLSMFGLLLLSLLMGWAVHRRGVRQVA